EYRAAQIDRLLAPGSTTRQGMQALEEVFAQTMSRDMGFDYSGMSFQEQVASQGVPASAVIAFSVLVVFLLMAALYESWTLPFAVLLATPIAMFFISVSFYVSERSRRTSPHAAAPPISAPAAISGGAGDEPSAGGSRP